VATCAIAAGNIQQLSKREVRMKYEKPAVQRFGTIREITLGSGPNTPGDATNLYHRS
jgi:hypothetical protein